MLKPKNYVCLRNDISMYHAWSLSDHGRLKILWSGPKNHIFGRPHGGVMDFRFL